MHVGHRNKRLGLVPGLNGKSLDRDTNSYNPFNEQRSDV